MGTATLQAIQKGGEGDSAEKMGGDIKLNEEKEKEGTEAGVGGP